MSRRAPTSIVVALLLAAVPATAFADGAGDNQYQDPLAAPTTPKKVTKKAVTAPVTTTTPAAAAAPTTAAAPAPASSSSPVAASPSQLPRTGAPADLIGLAGAALIASGAALRRRTAAQ